MSDDWKGEHLIRISQPDEHRRRSGNMQVINSMVAERNRRFGIKPNGAAQHDRFVKSLFRQMRKDSEDRRS